MEYEDILKRIIPKLKRGLEQFWKNQNEVAPGIFQANFDPLNDAANTISFDYNKPNALFNHKLRQNLGYFAMRKSLAEQQALTGLLLNDEGRLRSFEEFYQASKSILKDYNRNWLAAEYKTTVRAARMATRWQEAVRDKDLYPNIEYLPSRAATPREDHRQFYHIIRPIDDPFWDMHLPPNGWNCLCGFKTTDKVPAAIPEDLPAPAKGFRHNVGKSAKPFDAEHPYYTKIFPDEQKFINEFKLTNPLYLTSQEGVQISLWAHAQGLLQNIHVAERVMRELKLSVKIRPHVEQGGKNPEYVILNTYADLYSPETLNPFNAINNAFALKREQMPIGSYIIVIDLTKLLASGHEVALARRIRGQLKESNRCSHLIIVAKKLVLIKKSMDYQEILNSLLRAKGSN